MAVAARSRGLLLAVVLTVPSGARAWEARIAGTGTGPGDARAIATASNGDVVAGGYLDESGTGADFAVVELAGADGSERWRVVLPGPDLGTATGLPNDRVTAVALDPAGDVLAAGVTSSAARASQFTAVKIDRSTGATIWRYDLPNDLPTIGSFALAMAVDSAGDAFVSGDAGLPTTVTKLTHDHGMPAWTVPDVGGPAIGLLPNGDVVVAGFAGTFRLNGTTGAQMWSTTTGFDIGAKLVVVPGGVVVAGVGGLEGHGAYEATFLRAADGGVVWSRGFPGPSFLSDSIVAIVTRGDTGVPAVLATRFEFCSAAPIPGSVGFDVVTLSPADGTTIGEYQVTDALPGASQCFESEGEALAASGTGDLFPVGTVAPTPYGSTMVTARLSGAALDQLWQIERPVASTPEVPGVFTSHAAAVAATGTVALAGSVLREGAQTATAHTFAVLTYATADGALRACGDGVRDPGEQCDDGNTAAGGCCSPDCRTAAPDGTSCDDGNVCTSGDVCAGGACAGGAAIPCAPCGACDPRFGCSGAPDDACGGSTISQGASLALTRPHGSRSRLAWRLRSGPATALSDLGDPLHNTGYALCTYANAQAIASIAPPGFCAGNRKCWHRTKRGFVYDDPRAPGGLSRLELHAGPAGRARFAAIGTGAHLVLPALPVDGDVTVQLRRTDAGSACWSADYTEVRKNRSRVFKASGR
jgi:cysteine-rich repeat protein